MSNFRGATVSDRRSIGNLLDRFEISLVDATESRRLAVGRTELWPGDPVAISVMPPMPTMATKRKQRTVCRVTVRAGL